MKIYNKVLNEIVEKMPVIPPEAGGIIGGREGIVCRWGYDKGCFERGCSYKPDVNSLNKVIEEWMNHDYDFMGIVHVHFGGSKGLSDGDKKYIEKIMKAMPDFIEKLYFPIVVQPEKQLFSYMSYRNFQGEIVIDADEVKVLL